jgi:hypothetical protein
MKGFDEIGTIISCCSDDGYPFGCNETKMFLTIPAGFSEEEFSRKRAPRKRVNEEGKGLK